MARRFRKSASVVERRIRDEHVLVPIMGTFEALDSIYSLNEAAGFIWRCAVEGLSEEEIAARLAEEYDVEAGTARGDTARTLDELVGMNALEPAEA